MMKTILVIEDEPTVRELIQELLTLEGFRVLDTENGSRGVELARQHQPDLILCDISMPDMDGFRVLTTLQQDPSTNTIPFIFLTARGSRADMRHGMALGADDYITKPCTPAELLEAVTTRFERQAVIRNHTQQQLDDLRSSIALALPHELHTPLNGILLYSEILADEYNTIDRTELLEIAAGIRSSADRLYRLVQNFLCYAQLELTMRDPDRLKTLQTETTICPEQLIRDAAIEVAKKNDREADLHLCLENTSLGISSLKLHKIMEELIENAFKFSAPGTPVHIKSASDRQQFVITITDSGRGMTPEQIANLGAYVQFDRRLYEQQGTGLGLTIAKRLLELYGGRLVIHSTPGEQTIVQVWVPLAAADSQVLSAA